MASQMNFWHSLNDKKLISNDEAFHGMMLFYCQVDHANGYDDRVNRFKADGFLPDNFAGAANEAVTRGRLASILAQMLKVKGGVMMRLVGPTPRYALKELIALNIFPKSSAQQVLKGAQFIEIVGRAEDYLLNAERNASANQLDAAANTTKATQPATPESKQHQTVEPQVQ